MNRRAVLLFIGAALLLAGCASKAATSPTTASPATSSAPSSSALPTTANLGPDHQVWLCRPGESPDPCTDDLTSTAVAANGTRTIEKASPGSDPKIDCFYVYPTVSAQKAVNANLQIDPEETSVAHEQASRYSQDCRVFAPMYRQVTVAGLFAKSSGANSGAIAYASALAAWKDYLKRYNDGRGFVLIGHSQGAFILEQIIKSQIDTNPTLRKRLVSAILLGGNVLVPLGKDVGGDFQHVPACQADAQTGCVIAYSSFNNPPPTNSLFARTTVKGDQVLCTNPASLGGGSGALAPYFPTHVVGVFSDIGKVPPVSTPWVTFPALFSAECEDSGGADWLQISDVSKVGANRFALVDALGPQWGLHLYDANVALGNLVTIVGDQAMAYENGGSGANVNP
jgi:hypothetical protein